VIIEHNIALNLAIGSERQKLAYLTELAEITDQTVSLHTRTTPENWEARGLHIATPRVSRATKPYYLSRPIFSGVKNLKEVRNL
jgi:hypothetical protein